MSLLNGMYFEISGDRTQCMYLLSYFYRTQMKQKQLEVKKNSTLNRASKEKDDVILGEESTMI